MSDFTRDPWVEGVFSGVSSAVAEHINPRGVEMVYRTVRRRRRNRALATGAMVLALIAVPAGFALANGLDGRPPVGNDPTTPAPSTAPAPSGTPTESPSGSPAAPNGRISLATLKNATLKIPAWPRGQYNDDSCARGEVQFHGGTTEPESAVALIGDPIYVDVDRDGAQETVMVVECSPQSTDYQVLAFDRTEDGKIYTFGQVVATVGGVDGKMGKDVLKIWGIRAEPGGQVGVDVGDVLVCCAVPRDMPQHQWRTYGWDGERFTQTGGPTEFGPNPKFTELKVSVDGPLSMTRQENGTWRGTLKITVSNAGPLAAAAQVSAEPSFEVTISGPRCELVEGFSQPVQAGTNIFCAVDQIAVDGSRAVSLTFTSTAKPTGTVEIEAKIASDKVYGDLDEKNNVVQVRVATG